MSWNPCVEVEGFRPPNDEFRRKMAAWRACKDADIEPPKELYEFFGLDPDECYSPAEQGVRVPLGESVRRVVGQQRPSDDDHMLLNAETCGYYEIDITRLPEGIRFLRVFMR